MLKRILFSTCIVLFVISTSTAQHETEIFGENAAVEFNTKTIINLDESTLFDQIRSKKSTIMLPYLGQYKEFAIEEFSMHAGGKNPYPDIRTYKTTCLDNKLITGRITAGPAGLMISYQTNGTMYRIYPDMNSKSRIYYHEYGIVPNENGELPVCDQHGEIESNSPAHNIHENNEKPRLKRNGQTKRQYRVAVVCTGEYYQANGNSDNAVRQMAIANLTDISAIFEKDLGVEMVMASGAPEVRYSDPDTDVFIPDNSGGQSRTAQAEQAVMANFTSNRYDIGHVFHKHSSGDGWSSGGVAGLGVVCANAFKGRGWSGSFSNSGNGFIQLAAHEFGHQYWAPHTFNGSGVDNCDSNISPSSSYEIGSGSTIMSYQGICDPEQNIPSMGVDDNYFHAHSLNRMVVYMEDNGECNTDNWIEDNNNEPVVDANPCGAVYELPRLTPFFLTGSATDADGDVLTYCWEGYDEDGNPSTATQGFIGVQAQTTTELAPLWRSFPPSPSPTRYFPQLTNVVNNINSDFEVLPGRSRNMKFRLTVRDNNPAGGAIDWQEIGINVTSTIGPLEVTSPSPNDVVQAGETLMVTWNPRNSQSICNVADIKISFDGGLTYPITLGDDVDYAAGAANITIPASLPNTDKARIMVACADYDCFQFYDIMNANFTIESDCFAPGNLLCDTEYEEFNTNDPGLNLGLENIKGTTTASISSVVENVPPTMPPSVNDFNGNCTRIASINNAFDTIPFVVTESGSYTFNFNTNGDNFIKAYTIYDAATFVSSNGCASFIESNASFNGNFGFFDFMTVELEACTEYLLGAHITNGNTRDIALSSITGPGFMLVQEPSPDFAATYLAVDANTNVIVAFNDNSDFTLLGAGEYHIHAVYYKDGGAVPPENIDPASWIGTTTNDLLNSGDCYNLSANFKPITIISTCTVENLMFGTQSSCDPLNNTFTQEISFDIDMGPEAGTVEINGQSFQLSSNSFSATLTGLLSDGLPVDVTIDFSEDLACNAFIPNAFQAPFNCCPIDIDLGPDIIACLNDDVILDAGDDGTVYQWFKDGAPQSEDTKNFTVTEDGIYRVIVTDSNGCAKDEEIEVSFNILPTLDIGNNILACEGDTAIATAITLADSIVWLKDGVVFQDNNEATIVVTEAGEYECIVTNEFNCSVSLTITATFSESPDVDLGPDQVVCEGDIVTLIGSNPNDIHIWTRDGIEIPEFTNMLEVTENGLYALTASNSNGCVSSDEVQIAFEPLPDLDLGEDQMFCEGESYDIVANAGGFNIEWFKDDVLIAGETDVTLTVTETGVYKAVVSAGVDCMIEDDVTVTFNESPVVELGDDQFLCEGQTYTLDAGNPGATFIWAQDGMGLTETSNMLDVTENGEYVVVVTNNFNCSAGDVVNINFEDLPDIDLGEDRAICAGQSLILVAQTGGFNVEWYKDDVLLPEDDGTLNVTETGTYRVVVFSNMDCMVEDEVTIEVLDLPVVDLGEDATLCEGEVLTLDAGDPANMFTWFRDGIEIMGETNNTLDVTEDGIYSVENTNAGNCTTIDVITVTFLPLPDLDLGEDQLLCEGESYDIVINVGGFDIQWSKDNAELPGETGSTLTVNETGDYHVVVSSAASNCSISDTLRVEFNVSPTIDLGEDQLLCEGSEFVIVAGSADNDYVWTLDGGDLSNDLNSYTATLGGEYIVTSTNMFDCSSSDTLNVAFNARPTIDLGMDQELCQGDDYVIVATTNGFDIEWQLDNNVLGGEVELELTTTTSGQYIATVASGIDCTTSDTVNILYNPVPDINLGADQTACEGETIILDAGTTGLDFTWYQDGMIVQEGTESTLDIVVAGEFVVEATNEFNCTTSDTTITNFIAQPVVELDEDFDFCEGEEVTISSTTNVSSATWFQNGTEINGEVNTELTINTGGEYVIVVGTGNQCEDRDTITATAIAAPDFMIDGVSQECTGTDVVLTVDAEAGESISWFENGVVIDMETDASLTVTTSALYSATLENSTGCTSTEEFDVAFFDLPVNSLISVPTLCEGDMFTMVATSDGASFSWMDDNGVIAGETGLELDITASGDYSFIAANTIGCETRTDFSVTFNPIPDANLGADQSACTGESVLLSVDDVSGNTYEWSLDGQIIAGETSNELSVSAEGTYGLVITSSANCTDSDEVDFTFNTPPTLDFEDTASFCEGGSADLQIITDASVITWTLNSQVVASNTTSINVTEGGDYMLSVTSDEGCELEGQITVNAFANPVVDIDDIELCPGESQDIDLDPGFETYVWTGINASGSSTTIMHEVFAQVTVVSASIEVTNSNDCQASDDFSITYNPELNAAVFDETVNLCQGETDMLQVSGGLYYEWTDPNGTLSATDIPNPVASPQATTTYNVLITDDCPNNMAEFDIEVTVNALPEANAGSDTCVIMGQLLELEASGGVSYLWDNQTSIQGSFTIANPVISIDTATVFTVTVIDDNGCTDTDQVEVCIIDDATDLVDAVTLITPNNDGSNDELVFRGLEGFPENKLTIFNRWGNIIYEKIGYQRDDARWNGLRDGVELPPDVYYYVLEFAGTKIKSGITILRD